MKIHINYQILSDFHTRGLIIDLNLGQLIVFKGMLIGIFKSQGLFQQEHFGIIFSQNFTRTEIELQIGDGVSMTKELKAPEFIFSSYLNGVITDNEESLKFPTAINF